MSGPCHCSCDLVRRSAGHTPPWPGRLAGQALASVPAPDHTTAATCAHRCASAQLTALGPAAQISMSYAAVTGQAPAFDTVFTPPPAPAAPLSPPSASLSPPASGAHAVPRHTPCQALSGCMPRAGTSLQHPTSVPPAHVCRRHQAAMATAHVLRCPASCLQRRGRPRWQACQLRVLITELVEPASCDNGCRLTHRSALHLAAL